MSEQDIKMITIAQKLIDYELLMRDEEEEGKQFTPE
jgi:hypothetical protein